VETPFKPGDIVFETKHPTHKWIVLEAGSYSMNVQYLTSDVVINGVHYGGFVKDYLTNKDTGVF